MRVMEGLAESLASADFKCAIVSMRHLSDIRRDLEQLLEERSLNRAFYDEIVSRLDLHWDFDPPVGLPQAKSILITAVPHAKTSLEFELAGSRYYAIIPPTYIVDTDREAESIISLYLGEYGYKICNALLPAKLLAVRSGLARYGKNNITYIDDWGSYYRLKIFFSDLPCPDDHWQEPEALAFCSKCAACINKCPTHAISRDRFLIEAGKCLTFFNEASYEFPQWIDSKCHNCLIGCMICQDVCPANKPHVPWVRPGGEFSAEETSMILQGIPKNRLPAGMVKKLEKVNMLDDYGVLKRNLGALIENQQNGVEQ
jgi:epoxyqueuosine reductase